MAFTPYVANHVSTGRPAGGPRITARRPANKDGRVMGSQFYVTAALAKRLGWIPGDRVQVQIGTKEDRGTIVVTRKPTGLKLSKVGGKAECSGVIFTLSGPFAGRALPTLECIYHVSVDGVLTVELPRQFWPAEPSSKPEQKFNHTMTVAAE